MALLSRHSRRAGKLASQAVCLQPGSGSEPVLGSPPPVSCLTINKTRPGSPPSPLGGGSALKGGGALEQIKENPSSFFDTFS